jgi:DNA-binding NtrC family response regulator
MSNILIVDDEQSYRQLLKLVFDGEGHTIRTAANGLEAIKLLQDGPADVLISDVKMPDMDGIEMLRSLRETHPDLGVIFMTAFASVETAREAFKLGADDFIQKPFDVEELKLLVKKTLEKQELIDENRAFKRAQRQRGSVKNIVGTSDKMNAIFQMIETVAEVQSTILITGESGTGKELVARAIHDLGPRGEKPFISINCGAFTETLLESELFGYVKGSFTGANSNRKGLFEAANRGTIFLDEIGEMSPAMQVKLLRVLQERKVRPVDADRCTGDRRYQSRLETDVVRRVVPRRPLLPNIRDSHQSSPTTRTKGRHSRPDPSLRDQVLRSDRTSIKDLA